MCDPLKHGSNNVFGRYCNDIKKMQQEQFCCDREHKRLHGKSMTWPRAKHLSFRSQNWKIRARLNYEYILE